MVAGAHDEVLEGISQTFYGTFNRLHSTSLIMVFDMAQVFEEKCRRLFGFENLKNVKEQSAPRIFKPLFEAALTERLTGKPGA